MPTSASAARHLETLHDSQLPELISRGDPAAFEALMRRYNGKLFRIARAILKDDSEAEDALQDAYLDAYRHMGDFRGAAQLGTWLTQIVVNRALMRLRSQRRHRNVVSIDDGGGLGSNPREVEVTDKEAESPIAFTLRSELRRLLENRIDQLPVAFRTVFVMREVEDMTVQETAACLSLPTATVRSRLFRARALLRESLARDMDMVSGDVFAFAGARCDRIVARVLAVSHGNAEAEGCIQ